ncbi:protein jagged-2-like [Tubulanus polymorphus]|uniref:protein jagged-2-like n=1 Tax=Tubulanus polymorphus TaxID=672921 RepID=UPI003DA1F10A
MGRPTTRRSPRRLCLCLLFSFVLSARPSGFFELRVVSVQNLRSELKNGSCCDDRERRNAAGVCIDPCETVFRLCLKEYQTKIGNSASKMCSFGNISSQVMGANTFSFSEDYSGSDNLLVVPIEFAWTKAFTLILEIWDKDSKKYHSGLIETITHSNVILPGQDWHRLKYNGASIQLVYRIRVRCAEHYYDTCTKYCRPRNDKFGHYTCDVNGDKKCMDGWMGVNCETVICKTGCHPIHGSCSKPGECRCAYGWQGPLCDQCIAYPGCQHGSCRSPWECICDVNWGDILCNKDLNYCGTHKPCVNGGICSHSKISEYVCACPEGFTGTNCEIAFHACSSDPCQNGGTCVELNGYYVCTCKPGWIGANCEIDMDECASNPCLNHGTCIDQVNGYTCDCPDGWQGPRCQLDADECSGSPCVNAHQCKNLFGDYICDCQPGWDGKNCDINVDDCKDKCQNGATCTDFVNDFLCTCRAGYEGRYCEIDINECANKPCLNGGQCRDLEAKYECVCPKGYSGLLCQDDIDQCDPNPCRNNANCFNLQGDYFCLCPEGFGGKDCSQNKSHCQNGACQIVDSCTISTVTNVTGKVDTKLLPSNVCGKRGTCISHSDGHFECDCDLGYTGIYCQENVNDCVDNPCQNQGTCIDDVHSFRCICQDGWEGELCNLNKDDCLPNPCRNNGSCIDMIADFTCLCEGTWKGRICSQKTSSCDSHTCMNGGTCIDLGDTFTCQCAPKWEGLTCRLPTNYSCDSSPCNNGATCVNSGNSFTCLCKDGFDGKTCDNNINDCNPFPCYNGGTCIDGMNWYFCQCPLGFSGPDCRVNIDECSSTPCAYGATCIDGIYEYTCKCPLGRSGKNCDEVPPGPESCEFNRRIYGHNSTWQHECNSCKCQDGHVVCSKMFCGPRNCLTHPNVTEELVICEPHETCVVQTEETCFTPPCLPWGQCRKQDAVLDPKPPGLKTNCIPNTQNLNNDCARITLLFDKSKMPTGISVEGICNILRGLPILHTLAKDQALIILCGINKDQQDTIEVMVSTSDKNVLINAGKPMVHKAVGCVAEFLGQKRENSSTFEAIVEIKVEKTVFNEKIYNSPAFILPLVCSIIVILGIIALILLFICHQHRQRQFREEEAQTLEQKTNNENEENMRRYHRNPLFDRDKGGGTRKSPSSEMFEIVEKYEKSPRRHSGGKDLNIDPTNKNNAPFGDYVKKKNTNIEKSLMDKTGGLVVV